jgi:hypothetical protein
MIIQTQQASTQLQEVSVLHRRTSIPTPTHLQFVPEITSPTQQRLGQWKWCDPSLNLMLQTIEFNSQMDQATMSPSRFGMGSWGNPRT